MYMPIDAVGPASFPPCDLSLTEKNCLQLVAEGRSVREVGDDLALSMADVEALLSVAEGKLGARNRLHAISVALRKGAISF